jgi:hypothetical protein
MPGPPVAADRASISPVRGDKNANRVNCADYLDRWQPAAGPSVPSLTRERLARFGAQNLAQGLPGFAYGATAPGDGAAPSPRRFAGLSSHPPGDHNRNARIAAI